MKKLYIILITVLLAVTTSVGFAAGGHRGGGSAHDGSEGVTTSPFDTPRGFGEENPLDEDDMEHSERNFNEAAPGAWNNEDDSGKEAPSS